MQKWNALRLLVTDLDDTLLRRDKTISNYTLDVLRRARERGMLLAFATARNRDNAREYRDLLRPDGEILTGGCLVFAGEQLLQSHYMPEPQGAALLAELDAHPSVKRVGARSLHGKYLNIAIAGCVHADFQSPLPERLLHCSCRTDDAALMASVAARYPDFAFLHVSGSDLYDINPRDATKLRGIETLTAHFRLSLSEVAAFGDDHSDVGMLRACGAGVAMRNAIDECKAAAGFVCGDCDEDGAARWVEGNILHVEG